ncbi:MAG: acyltransferase [Butyrivibrio sp.]|nr:acyltransferase [Butyrivibrio sp.]
MDKAKVITYGKGMAIIAIVLYHLFVAFLSVPPIVKTASGFGGAGVHVFFLCSGFGLMFSHIRKPLTFIPFIKKRFKKIYIPYVIVILITFCLPAFFGTRVNRVLVLFSHVFLFKMFVPALEDTFGGHFWYISTIIQFYFVFVILAKLLLKYGKKKFLTASCSISFLWALLVYFLGFSEIRVWNSFFLQYLWEFALGMVIAMEYSETGVIRFEKAKTLHIILVVIISFGIYFVMSLAGGGFKSFNDPFSLASIGGIFLLLYRWNFLPGFIEFTSDISYEIYLLHVMALKIVFICLGGILPEAVLVIISFITIYIVAYAYHIFCQKLLNSKMFN